jgi:hypothetical protein
MKIKIWWIDILVFIVIYLHISHFFLLHKNNGKKKSCVFSVIAGVVRIIVIYYSINQVILFKKFIVNYWQLKTITVF